LTTLRVSNQNENGVGALRVVGVDRAGYSGDTLNNRVGIADTTAGGLATTSGVVDSLGSGSRIGGNDRVDDVQGSTIACWSSRFTSTKDVNRWAVGALLEEGGGSSEAGKEEDRGSELVKRLLQQAMVLP